MESIEESMTMTSGVGTPFYMAPEMIKSSKHYTGAVDVYSFAIMAAQVIVGRLIYDAFDFDTQFCLYLLFFRGFLCSFFTCVLGHQQHLSALCVRGYVQVLMDVQKR